MSLERLTNLLVIVTLIEMMVLIGLRVKLAELLSVAKDWRLSRGRRPQPICWFRCSPLFCSSRSAPTPW
jgi:hypothetical protein